MIKQEINCARDCDKIENKCQIRNGQRHTNPFLEIFFEYIEFVITEIFHFSGWR